MTKQAERSRVARCPSRAQCSVLATIRTPQGDGERQVRRPRPPLRPAKAFSSTAARRPHRARGARRSKTPAAASLFVLSVVPWRISFPRRCVQRGSDGAGRREGGVCCHGVTPVVGPTRLCGGDLQARCPPPAGPGMARTSSPPEAERGKDRPWSLPLPDLPTLRGDVESSHGTRACRCDFSLPVRTRRFSASRRVQSPRSASAHGAGTLRCQTNARPLGCEAGCCLFRKEQRAQLTYAQIIGSVTFLIQTSC